MNPQSLPTSARLRRSLARRRVRELRHEQPVLEWLYGRLIVTETALGDVARANTLHARTSERVLRGNGYAAKVDAASIVLEAQLAALSEAATDPLLDSERPSLLLADRDPLLLRALRRVFQRRYQVLVTTTASDALTLLAEQAVDVIVTDRDLDQTYAGVWLLEQARASFPEAARILVSEQAFGDAAGSGETVEHWVRKGARLEVLHARIARALERG